MMPTERRLSLTAACAISAQAVRAIIYFPAPVALPVVLGMIFQQSTASLVGFLLSRHDRVKARGRRIAA